MTYPRTLTLDSAPNGGVVVFEDNTLIWAGSSPPDLIIDRESDDRLAKRIVAGVKNTPSKVRAIQILKAATGYDLKKAKDLIDEHYGPFDSNTTTLTLTSLEAETLKRLLGAHVVGPDNGPRGILNGIWDKLPYYPPNPFQTKGGFTLYIDEDD